MSEEPDDIEALRAEIARAARIDDPVERALEIVAAIDCVAAPFGIHPVVVGGMAVCFWTATMEFATYDIDLVMDIPEALARHLGELGFVRADDRRHWTLPGTAVFLEAPSSHLDPDAIVSDIELRPGRSARVLSRLDLLLDRLDEFQATGHETPALQALALLSRLSPAHAAVLDRRATERRVTKILEAIREIAANLAAGDETPDSGELHEIARAALRAEYPSE